MYVRYVGRIADDNLITYRICRVVAKAFQHLRGTKTMEEIFIVAADVVKDNELKLNDIAKIYQYVRQKIETLE